MADHLHLDFSSAAVDNHFSMLRLDSSSALKRPSPPSSSSHQPKPKKEKLSPPLPLFPGFSKITPLPPLPKSHSSRPTRTSNPLLHRRCTSDPFTPNAAAPVTAASPPSVVSTRPPRPTLHRTVSDPTSSPANKSRGGSSSSGDGGDDDDTPNTKRRLKRIRDRFKEMTLWFEQVMLEENDDEQAEMKVAAENQEEEEEEQIINAEPTDDEPVHGLENTAVTKEDCDQKRFEESVNVEKVGECIVIHFRCHCGVPYQFLLAGGNYYYKLM